MRHELIAREQHEIRSIVHVDRSHAIPGRPGGDTHHRFLGQWRVEDPVAAELLLQAPSCAEHGRWIVDPLAEQLLVDGRFGEAAEVTIRVGNRTGERLVPV